MKKFLLSSALLFVTVSVFSQETIKIQDKYTAHNKGKFFVSWGGNRETYSKSDITFKGISYDFTINDATAHDKPKGWHIDYINPGRMTIPQTNFRIGYFVNDHYSVAIGVDHMKYVMRNDQAVTINGNINTGGDFDGTYNNDEYAKFNQEITKVQKKLVDFQTKNTPAMQAAQQAKDTASINKLMQEFGKIQQEVGEASKVKYQTYAESHPKSFISVLILQGMLNDPSTDVKKAEATFNALEEKIQNTKPGKAVKEALAKLKSATTAPPAIGGAK